MRLLRAYRFTHLAYTDIEWPTKTTKKGDEERREKKRISIISSHLPPI